MKRDVSVDLVKVVAIIGVLIIHTCGWNVAVGSGEWIAGLFWGSISRASVPLFLMASGAVMLNTKKEISLKKLYSKNILRILAAMFFWGVAYKVYSLCIQGVFSAEGLWQGIKEVLVFNQEFHFYYMHMILIVYIFLPITRIIVKNATKNQLQYFLGVWFVFSSLFPTLKVFYPFSLLGGVTGQWAVNLVYSSIGFGVLGLFLKEYGLPRIISVLSAIAGFLIIFVGTYEMSLKYDILYEHFLAGTGVGAVLLAVGIFGLIGKVNIKKEKIKNAIIWLSKASFAIYLVHMLIIYTLNSFGVNIEFTHYILSIPVIALTVGVVSAVVYLILSKIPVIKNWII